MKILRMLKHFKTGKMVLLMGAIVVFVGACAPTLTPVATLEDFTTKEYLKEKRSWHSSHKPVSALNIGQVVASSGASITAPILVPIIAILTDIKIKD